MRPEALTFASRPGADTLQGVVSERRYAGRVAYYVVATPSGEVEVLAPPNASREGDQVLVAPSSGGPVPRAFRRSG